MWTLYFEFFSYLLLMLLALTRALRSRLTVLASTIVLFIAIVVITFTPGYRVRFNLYHWWIPMNMMKFAVIFLVGALIYLYRDKIPDSGWLALGCLVVFVGCLWLPTPNRHPAVAFTGSAIMAPVLTYPILWLGAHLPFEKVGARNDYSYGFYIVCLPGATDPGDMGGHPTRLPALPGDCRPRHHAVRRRQLVADRAARHEAQEAGSEESPKGTTTGGAAHDGRGVKRGVRLRNSSSTRVADAVWPKSKTPC